MTAFIILRNIIHQCDDCYGHSTRTVQFYLSASKMPKRTHLHFRIKSEKSEFPNPSAEITKEEDQIDHTILITRQLLLQKVKPRNKTPSSPSRMNQQIAQTSLLAASIRATECHTPSSKRDLDVSGFFMPVLPSLPPAKGSHLIASIPPTAMKHQELGLIAESKIARPTPMHSSECLKDLFLSTPTALDQGRRQVSSTLPKLQPRRSKAVKQNDSLFVSPCAGSYQARHISEESHSSHEPCLLASRIVPFAEWESAPAMPALPDVVTYQREGPLCRIQKRQRSSSQYALPSKRVAMRVSRTPVASS